MKILLVNNFYYPRFGGSSTVVEQLADNFVKLGHEVLILTGEYSNAPEYEIRNKYRISRIPTWTLPKTRLSLNFDINFGLVRGNLARVEKIIKDFQPDVIHCHGQFLDLTWKALKISKSLLIPTILTFHTRLVNPNPFLNLILFLGDKMIVYPMLRKYPASKFIIIDKNFVEYAEKRYKISRGKMVYIPVGVDTNKFRYGYLARASKNHRIVLSIGHVIAVRNRVALVKAFAKVQKEIPNSYLRIVGGIYQNKFWKIAQKLCLNDYVEANGTLSADRIPSELRGASIEVHDIQGYGISIASLEAMSVGVPTAISTDPDYFPHAPMTPNLHYLEVKKNDVDSISNAIIYCLRNPKEMKILSKNASEFIKKNFSIDKISREHIKTYENALR
jgi:1,2-diacylglycerol 3-alpha-glucosyltransferase